MREFFQRYNGPLTEKTVLLLGTEELGRRGFSNLATSASASNFHSDSAASVPGRKSPPLGVPLRELGSFVKTRFLEVLLHSQNMGKGKESKIFPLPTSRDHVSSFFVNALEEQVEWVVVICMSLNSYWGGASF